jgi:hypothetical protein
MFSVTRRNIPFGHRILTEEAKRFGRETSTMNSVVHRLVQRAERSKKLKEKLKLL